MHFDDLTVYSFSGGIADGKRRLNVGWLAGWAPFPKGEATAEFLAALFARVQSPIRKQTGAHVCCKAFQDSATELTRADLDGQEVLLGSAEIEVSTPDGGLFVAPDLIFHYVKEHRYLPPEAFVRACLAK